MWPPDFFSVVFYLLRYFWLCWVFVAEHGLSLAAASGSYSLAAVHRFLISVASTAL